MFFISASIQFSACKKSEDKSSDWSDNAVCVMNVTAYYEASSKVNYEDLYSTDLSYDINGSAGFSIGINGDETKVYVPISD